MVLRCLTVFLFLILMGCNNYTPNNIAEEELYPEGVCPFSLIANYNLSIRAWEIDTIKYDILDSRLDTSVIEHVLGVYSYHMNKTILFDSNEPDIIFLADTIDGPGYTLGQSFYPPVTEYSIHPVPVTFDVHDLDNPKHDFASIAYHEVGHSMGLRHSKLKNSVMWEKYAEVCDLAVDDKLGLRMQYKNFTPFKHDGEQFIPVAKNDYKKVSRNFTASEYAGECESISFISVPLIEVVQYLRDYYGPIVITSTFRNEKCNRDAGGATQSTHQLSKAVDIVFQNPNALSDFKADIKAEGRVYQEITKVITGIGLYDRHVHLDTKAMEKKRVRIWSGFSRLFADP